MYVEEINKVIEKQKDYLDQQKVFDSPDKYQWYGVTGEDVNTNTDNDILRNKIKNKNKISSLIFILRMSCIPLVSALSVLAISGVIPFITCPLAVIITITIALTGEKSKFRSKLRTGKRDNSLMENFDFDEKVLYSKLHRLIYVEGEFYRVWYVKYILGLDPKEFSLSDPVYQKLTPSLGGQYIGKSTANGGSYIYTTEEIENMLKKAGEGKWQLNTEDETSKEINRTNQLLKEARSEREHWINSLSTARFLDYEEFRNIQETDKAIEKAKELDNKVQQFEMYMKNKDKLKKVDS